MATTKVLDYNGLSYLLDKLSEKIVAIGEANCLPLTGGTLTGDLVVGGTTIQASDGHIVLSSGVEIY